MESKRSAAELLAQRGRTKVPDRDDHLTDLIGTQRLSERLSGDNGNYSSTSDHTDLVSKWKEELEDLPEISNFMLRVEKEIKEELQTYAKKQGLTAETLIQAMWVALKQDPKTTKFVLTEAKKHHQRRARAAELKNLVTRAEKVM
jgi:hypothetical protein